MSENKKWSCEQAWDWYSKQPWLRGCNYMPANCVNRIDMWQSYESEKHFEAMSQEFQVMKSIGYNSVRVILEFLVWQEEHDSFMERFERFIRLADSFGIRVMVCFGNDCSVPKNAFYRAPHLGKQEYDWGYHGGRKHSQHGSFPNEVGYSIMDEPDLREQFYRMTEEIISKYAKDSRICTWDLINEPGNNNRGEISVPHVKRLFEIARSCSPDQPLTSPGWGLNNPAEKMALDNSDVISFHNYYSYENNIMEIATLKKFGRPLFITEWLHRPFHNTVQQMFPLFYLEKISCWNWGFVSGLYQTYEPWESLWNTYDPKGNVDFTKWQHDLIRPSMRPYDPQEIEIIKCFSALADQEYAKKNV